MGLSNRVIFKHIIHTMKSILSLLIIILSVTAYADNRTRTTRRHLKPIIAEETTDTLRQAELMTAGSPDSLSISGYDKPLRSTRETFFLTNRHGSPLHAIKLHITYYTMGGEMLHSRDITIDTPIPPGETRQISTSSWDRQKAYYYIGTRVTPRSAKAIPYYPKIDIGSVLLLPRK